jgi:hypothetical protein
MAKDLITRTASRLYEERHLSAMGLDSVLFRSLDEDNSAAFRLDRYISSPYGMTYRNPTNQSIIRQFAAGSTELIEVPVASEKTPIDSELRDQVAVGNEPTVSQVQQMAKNVDQIIGDHVEAKNMTALKQAIDVPRTGIFSARGIDGADLGLDYDHGRNALNDITADLAVITVNDALEAVDARLNTTGTPNGNRLLIVGSDWASAILNDSTVLELRKANPSNELIAQERLERTWPGAENLHVIATYRPPAALSSYIICVVSPGTDYVEFLGATPEAWVPADELIALSLNDRTYKINRGIDALDDNGQHRRDNGDLVVDSFTTDDPVTTFIRSQRRTIYIYANIDHTLRSTGSNF